MGNVGSMTTCSVLRCQTPGSIEPGLTPEDRRSPNTPVCADHRERIKNGEPWMMDADLGIPTEDGIPVTPGRSIVMGADFPSRLTSRISLYPHNDGSWEKGYILELQLQTAGTVPAEKFWLSQEALDSLAMTTDPHVTPWPNKPGPGPANTPEA